MRISSQHVGLTPRRSPCTSGLRLDARLFQNDSLEVFTHPQEDGYDVIARAQAHNIDEVARLVTSQLQALDGVMGTVTSPVVHL